MDAELFKKYCLDSNRCNSCQKQSRCKSSYYEVANCLISKGIDRENFILQEWGCLNNFLYYIKKGKCTLYYNNSIKSQYMDLFDNMPLDLIENISYFLSNEGLMIKKENGNLNGDDLDIINSVNTLIPKKDYLEVVSFLRTRIIVSTQEDKRNVYTARHLVGLSLVPICKNVCEQRDEIQEEIN